MKTFQQFYEAAVQSPSLDVRRQDAAAKTRARLDQMRQEAEARREEQQQEQQRRSTDAKKEADQRRIAALEKQIQSLQNQQ